MFDRECTPGTPWEPAISRASDAAICEELPLYAPATHPLLGQLQAGADSGFTTLTVTVSTTGLDIAMCRRRHRIRRLSQP